MSDQGEPPAYRPFALLAFGVTVVGGTPITPSCLSGGWDKTVPGYRRLCAEHVLQADAGCDFDFLRAAAR